MKTSYFSKYKDADGISICANKPYWFSGKVYPDLYPKWSFLSQYKIDGNEDRYEKEYYAQVLNKLDPQKVYDDLKDSVLLCYEKSGKFCHRRLVAEWIENELGVEVPEICIMKSILGKKSVNLEF